MTTAHRPTWAPAKGGEEQGGMRIFAPSRFVSAKNQPGQLKLKYRKDGQGNTAEIDKRDLKAELEEKERKHFGKFKGLNFDEERQKDLKLLEAGPSADGPAAKPLVPKNIDADDEDPDDSDSSSSDDDDEDDEEELMKELEKIKAERAEEAAKKAREEAAKLAKEKEEELVRGNPLLSIGQEVSFNIKRRWDEDVVFKNQARGEPKAQKRFVNDTIRNDFHKRFLQRYMR